MKIVAARQLEGGYVKFYDVISSVWEWYWDVGKEEDGVGGLPF